MTFPSPQVLAHQSARPPRRRGLRQARRRHLRRRQKIKGRFRVASERMVRHSAPSGGAQTRGQVRLFSVLNPWLLDNKFTLKETGDGRTGFLLPGSANGQGLASAGLGLGGGRPEREADIVRCQRRSHLYKHRPPGSRAQIYFGITFNTHPW